MTADDAPSSIVIVGAGEAGIRAALTLRQEGWAGPLSIVHGERHPLYERPPLSKQILLQPEQPPPSISGVHDLRDRSIDLIQDEVVSLDRVRRQVLLAGGRALPYAKLLLATGARPRPLAIPGGEHALLLRHLGHAIALREALARANRLVVIGGGFIGLEVAAAARSAGLDVTVLEAGPRLMARAVPAEIADVVAGWHQDAGVVIETGATVTELRQDGDGISVHLGDGRQLQGALVLAGVGAVPDCGLAEAAGLAVDNGILVTETLQSVTDPAIFAAGDCAAAPHGLFPSRPMRLEVWRNARDQGTHAARGMLGARTAFTAVPWFWSDQYGMTLQIAGLPARGSRSVARALPGKARLSFHLDDTGRIVGAAGAGTLAQVAREIRLAEMLIERRLRPSTESLADPGVPLKALLKS